MNKLVFFLSRTLLECSGAGFLVVGIGVSVQTSQEAREHDEGIHQTDESGGRGVHLGQDRRVDADHVVRLGQGVLNALQGQPERKVPASRVTPDNHLLARRSCRIIKINYWRVTDSTKIKLHIFFNLA